MNLLPDEILETIGMVEMQKIFITKLQKMEKIW